MFLRRGVLPSGRNTEALLYAVLYGLEEITHILLKGGANVNKRFENGQTALHVAAMEGHCNIVRLLLKCGAEIEAQDDDGYPPLFAAVDSNIIEIIQVLLKQGANADVKHPRYGFKALHLASTKENLDMVRLFCERDVREDDVNLALCLAAQRNTQIEIVSLLKDRCKRWVFCQIHNCFRSFHTTAFCDSQ